MPRTPEDEGERLYRRSLRIRRDDTTRLAILLAGARLGHAECAWQAGRHLVYGWGCEADSRRGFEWLERSAAAGCGDAYWQLAYFHQEGIGTARDARRAVGYAMRGYGLTRAAHCATIAADVYAHDLLDEKLAAKWYRRGATAGDSDAMTCLGFAYRYGRGVEQDLAEAVRWYRRAARRGCANATGNLAICFKNGEGVRKDARRAYGYRVRAAALGHTRSAIAVTECLIDGIGVRRDSRRGLAALRALARRNPEAANELGERYLKGRGVPIDRRRGVRWLRRAAEGGDSDALTTLGVCLYYGRGVRRDHAEAVRLYRQAAEKGSPAAWRNLGLCYRDGEGVRQNAARARACFARAREHGLECDDDGKQPDEGQ
jgi:TPR repeat protein